MSYIPRYRVDRAWLLEQASRVVADNIYDDDKAAAVLAVAREATEVSFGGAYVGGVACLTRQAQLRINPRASLDSRYYGASYVSGGLQFDRICRAQFAPIRHAEGILVIKS